FSTAAVFSRGVPAGISTTTCISDLLSKGSIFSKTKPVAGSAKDAAIKPITPKPKKKRLRTPFLGCKKGRKMPLNNLLKKIGSFASWSSFFFVVLFGFSHRRANQGVKVNAMAKESAMPMLALMGIGLM